MIKIEQDEHSTLPLLLTGCTTITAVPPRLLAAALLLCQSLLHPWLHTSWTVSSSCPLLIACYIRLMSANRTANAADNMHHHHCCAATTGCCCFVPFGAFTTTFLARLPPPPWLLVACRKLQCLGVENQHSVAACSHCNSSSNSSSKNIVSVSVMVLTSNITHQLAATDAVTEAATLPSLAAAAAAAAAAASWH